MNHPCPNAGSHPRRVFLQNGVHALAAGVVLSQVDWAIAGESLRNELASKSVWKPKFILGSSLYGYTALAEILGEMKSLQTQAIDLWPKVHGDQREQLDAMGEEKFSELLAAHDVELGCITQYKLGPFALQDEMKLAQRLGCQTIVTGAAGPKGLKGSELKQEIKKFAEQMKPHLELAARCDVTIAIENHANSLIDSADGMRWLMELRSSDQLAIAFAPYHLPQDIALITELIADLRDGLAMFYLWQHGNGCMTAQPKESELLQMPGRGTLDFGPIMKQLQAIQYEGWLEIFMHPFPRGVPILPTTTEVTAEINRSRRYIEDCMTAS